MRFMLTALFASLVAACGAMPGMPGYVSDRTSQFDGSKEVRVEPGGVRGGGMVNPFAIGAHWSSKHPDTVVLDVELHGEYVHLDSRDGLQISIDGELVQLDSPQVFTDLQSARGVGYMRHRSSSKSYPMSLQEFDRMLGAREVKMKLITARGYLEGTLSDDYPGSAIEGLRRFRRSIPR